MNIYISAPAGKVLDTFLTHDVRAELAALGNVDVNLGDSYQSALSLPASAKKADCVISCWGTPRYEGEYLAAFADMKLAVYLAGSVAGVVSDEFFASGRRIISANRVFARSVAEGCAAYMLCALRRLPHYCAVVREGGWRSEDFSNAGLLGRSVGLVGFGTVARYLAPILRLLGAEVFAYDKFVSPADISTAGVTPCSFDEVFEKQVVSVHLARTPETVGMIGERQLARIPDGGLFVNTARGAVVDTAALVRELESGRLSAALDVFDPEPLDASSPLRTLANVLAVPHMAGPTIDARRVCGLALARDIGRFMRAAALENEISQLEAARMTR